MEKTRREFIKIELRLIFADHRFFTLDEWEQLIYIKMIAIAKVTNNKIPKDFSILKGYLRTNRSESDVQSALNRLMSNFHKFRQNKYFYYFKSFPQYFFKDGVDKDKDIDKDKEKQFDALWLKYPKRVGKKEALRHFIASVETEQDLIDIGVALQNYLRSPTVAKGFIQNGSTWFNNWRDWITPPEGQGIKYV